MTVGGDSLFTRGTGGGFKFYIKRDAVDVVPYEPAHSLKHNDTRGKTVRLCPVSIPYPPMTANRKEGYAFRHVNAPYPPMTVGGDAHGAP